jgi:hypothetical protein
METVEEEFVFSEQFFVPAQKSHALWNGERLLLLAVLENAVAEFYRYCHSHTRREKRLFREVEEWLSSGERNWLYSFESICLYLDFAPDTIRHGLRQYTETIVPSPSPDASPLQHEVCMIEPLSLCRVTEGLSSHGLLSPS